MRNTLALASKDRPWSLLLRHATRPPIPAGSFGNDLSITEEGRREAVELGELLRGRIRRVVTSPIFRCVETAEAIRCGGQASCQAATDNTLGDPGVWIKDGDAAGDAFLRHGPRGVVARQLAGDALPGMTPIGIGAARFIDLLISDPGEPGEIDVLVSHDAVIAPLLATVLGVRDLAEIWPAYLEGALLCREGDGLAVLWRGVHHTAQWRPTCRAR